MNACFGKIFLAPSSGSKRFGSTRATKVPKCVVRESSFQDEKHLFFLTKDLEEEGSSALYECIALSENEMVCFDLSTGRYGSLDIKSFYAKYKK